ncbi:hypothetical protein [Chryseobacterium sp. MA9]|uniref:hypothetical protein n=1 Tax=Chryseobacterium sp. MA9 TaxID=2966625 RepID=UPI002101F37C|nr:hypothetical protein [Chryseobacterium sp. MA9]UTX49029.1 hypothetical protein KIK00_01795 [Chryseobacterium sp. MA9]
MKKTLFQAGAFLCGTLLYSQTGINISQPKATLDIHGFETDVKKADGVIAPRITGNQLKAKDALYTDELKGAMVYVTEGVNPASIKTANVISAGYYYFDGSIWIKLYGGTFNGDPSPDAFIDDIANNMVKLGFSSSGSSRIAGSDFVIKDNGNVGIGNPSPTQKLEVSGNGKFESGNTHIDIVSNGINPANINLMRNNNGTNLSNGNLIGYFNFNGRVNGVDNTPLSTIVSSYQGNGTGNESSIDFRTSGTSNVDMKLDENGNLGIGTTTPSKRLDVQGTGIISGRLGIGVADPENKLDVDGNARIRAVPLGALNDTDKYVGITSEGILKKFDIALPSFGLFATSTQTVTRNADGVPRPLAFDDVNKVDNAYITKTGPNTFRVNKYGIYTVEVWGLFSDIPEANDGVRTGCTIKVDTGGKTAQLIGSRWELGDGTTNVTRTMILNANSNITVESRCLRNGDQQYRTAPGSTVFITYIPI